MTRILGIGAAVLDARLDIYSVNFGDASRHLEAARSALRVADARLKVLGRQEELNQDANALAAEAANSISNVLGIEKEGAK